MQNSLSGCDLSTLNSRTTSVPYSVSKLSARVPIMAAKAFSPPTLVNLVLSLNKNLKTKSKPLLC